VTTTAIACTARSRVLRQRSAPAHSVPLPPHWIVTVGSGTAGACSNSRSLLDYEFATDRLTESFAAELKDRGVRVNAVLPSVLDTAANRETMPEAEFGRWVSVDALARVIAFLASDSSRAVTGALLPVMGRL